MTPPSARKLSFPNALRELQAAVCRNHLGDPSYSQSAVFHYYAPLFALLSILGLGALVPRYADIDSIEGLSVFAILVKACLVVTLGVGGGLILFRALIWVGATLVTWFCEMDLSEREVETIGEKGAELELTQANLIIGGLLG